MNRAFMKTADELAAVYAAIPEGIAILVSDQPPHDYGDGLPDPRSATVEHLGSRELLLAIDRVRPKVVICGHIHDGHGRYGYSGIPIDDVSVVDAQYRRAHSPMIMRDCRDRVADASRITNRKGPQPTMMVN
jgi:hypothetical protein